MDNTAAIERIKAMEQRFDSALKAAAELDEAIERFKDSVQDVEALIAYYESDIWRSDYEADAEGKFPANLKRGVLSEDGIYNLLTDYQRLKEMVGCVFAQDERGDFGVELWDAYDRNFNKIANVTLVRGESIPDGVFHLVCDVIVKHTDGSYLLMQRDFRKHYGGLWEATAGGAALRGEDAMTCARRELLEETGVAADNLTEVGRVRKDQTIYVEFLCVTNCAKDSVTLQQGETIAYRWVSRAELIAMKADELVTQRMQTFMEELQR